MLYEFAPGRVTPFTGTGVYPRTHNLEVPTPADRSDVPGTGHSSRGALRNRHLHRTLVYWTSGRGLAQRPARAVHGSSLIAVGQNTGSVGERRLIHGMDSFIRPDSEPPSFFPNHSNVCDFRFFLMYFFFCFPHVVKICFFQNFLLFIVTHWCPDRNRHTWWRLN